jgi:hypothetical protein
MYSNVNYSAQILDYILKPNQTTHTYFYFYLEIKEDQILKIKIKN